MSHDPDRPTLTQRPTPEKFSIVEKSIEITQEQNQALRKKYETALLVLSVIINFTFSAGMTCFAVAESAQEGADSAQVSRRSVPLAKASRATSCPQLAARSTER